MSQSSKLTATVAAAAIVLAAQTASADMLTAIGAGEGEVSIVAWPGYIERGESDPAYDWVTGFEKATGCKVTVKTAGSSDEMVSLMNAGGFDLVTASGDASLRLIAGNTVQEINTSLITDWSKIDANLQSAVWHTVNGKHYGVPWQWGANVLMYNATCSRMRRRAGRWCSRSRTLPDGKSNKGRVEAYYGPIYIADAALYLMTHKPELGIQDPYALTKPQFDAADRVAARAAPDRQQILGRCGGAGRRLHLRRRGRLDLLAVPGQRTARRRQDQGRLDRAEGRRHRMGRHHHDARCGAAS